MRGFSLPKTKSIPPKGCLFYFRFRIFPGKSSFSFFPVIPVLFPMKHFSKKRPFLNQLSFLLLFSAGFFFPIFRQGIGMLPHPLTAVCLSFLYAGNRNIPPCFRNQRKNRLPWPCKNFFPESGLSVFSEFTGIFSIVSRETFFFPCILKKADIKRCPNRLLLIQIFFRSDSFSYGKKSGHPSRGYTLQFLFLLHSPLQKQESEAVPGRTFLTKRLSGDSNR